MLSTYHFAKLHLFPDIPIIFASLRNGVIFLGENVLTAILGGGENRGETVKKEGRLTNINAIRVRGVSSSRTVLVFALYHIQ